MAHFIRLPDSIGDIWVNFDLVRYFTGNGLGKTIIVFDYDGAEDRDGGRGELLVDIDPENLAQRLLGT